MQFPNTKILFKGKLGTHSELFLCASSLSDALSGVKSIYPELEGVLFGLVDSGFDLNLKLNGKTVSSAMELNQPLEKQSPDDPNIVEIGTEVLQEGRAGSILLGIGFLALSFTGVGLLGISATTFGLLGGSLLFSSLFKVTNSDQTKDPEKRSVNFSNSINTVGASPLPLWFGRQVWGGSIVVSVDITPQNRSV